MIKWPRIAECIFKATMISFSAHKAGLNICPIMAHGPDGMIIALEQKHIVTGWEL